MVHGWDATGCGCVARARGSLEACTHLTLRVKMRILSRFFGTVIQYSGTIQMLGQTTSLTGHLAPRRAGSRHLYPCTHLHPSPLSHMRCGVWSCGCVHPPRHKPQHTRRLRSPQTPRPRAREPCDAGRLLVASLVAHVLVGVRLSLRYPRPRPPPTAPSAPLRRRRSVTSTTTVRLSPVPTSAVWGLRSASESSAGSREGLHDAAGTSSSVLATCDLRQGCTFTCLRLDLKP